MTPPLYRDSAVRKVDNQDLVAERLLGAPGGMETRKQCAYNQTKERFAGVDIDAGDFSVASLDNRIPALTPKSGAGLWLVPFRGIPATSAHIPLDLIYLDRNCTVIDVVESFPIYRVSSSSPPAASVLVLPARMIEATGTERGDQLILCAPEEMKWRLQKLTAPNGATTAVQSSAPKKEEPVRGSGPTLLQWEDRNKVKRPDEDRPNEDKPVAQPPNGKVAVEPASKAVKAPKSWWQKLLDPDPPEPRKTLRESVPGLSAYFWTGGVSVHQDIQDISPTGFFVITDERWYPGTIVRMTLTDRNEPTVERSITVNAAVVRWGNNGVGMQFVIQDPKNPRRGQGAVVEGVDKRELDQFLLRIKSAKV
jgi:hypothetical protein